VCLLSPQCTRRHRPTACEKLRKLSLQHRQSVIAEKELCVYCLGYSDLDTVRTRDCTKRKTQAHWLSVEARDPSAPPCVDRELPPVEPKVGRVLYACCANIRVKLASDSRTDSYKAQLATLFEPKRQMSVIALDAAIGPGLPYRTLPKVEDARQRQEGVNRLTLPARGQAR
jgi:hypothetical protein